jgi:tripartite ATP-independent transporter DctP family solute receptor
VKVKLVKIVAYSILIVFVSAFVANAGSITIKLAHGLADEGHYHAMTSTFRELVEKGTEGRVVVQVFPNGQLGTIQSLIEQTQGGLIQATTSQSVALVAAYYPNLQIMETPFAFKTPDEIIKFFDTDFVRQMVEDCAKTKGLRLLAVMPAGMRCFSNNKKPIVTPDDMKGMSIRVLESPLWLNMVENLGASPTIISWEELYTALQTGVVDGQENAPSSMLLANLQEVQKYYTLTNHIGNVIAFAMNEKFFQSLSAYDQEIIKEAAKKASAEFVRVVSEKEESDLKIIGERMEIILLTDAQRNKFVEKALQPALSYLKNQIGEDVVNKFVEELRKLK